jgi:ribokinase
MKQAPKSGEAGYADIQDCPGGKGNNEAVACSRAGGETAFIGVVGDDYEKTLKKSLLEDNITPILQTKKNIETHKAVIIVEEKGKSKILIKPGADYYLDISQIDNNIKFIEHSEIIIFNLEIPLNTVSYAIKKCNQKKNIIILRPSFISKERKEELSKDLIARVNYIIVNESELYTITGMPTNNEDETENACKKFMEKEPQNLIVILRNKGCILWNKEVGKKKYDSYYNENDIVDFTGAVDCFIGVFAAFLSNKYNLDEAIKYANLAVSLCVKKVGTIVSFPKLKEINDEKVKIRNW